MAKKIREQDIFQGDIFANSKKSAESYLQSLNALQSELKEMLSINKQLLTQSSKELKTTEQLQKKTQAIQNITKANKGLNDVEVQKLKTEQELEKLAQQRERTEQQRQKTRVQNRKEEERLAKIKAKNLKLAKQENSTYAMQSKKLNELRKRYKDLAIQNKQNTTEGKKLLKTIQQLDTRLKKVDKSVGQSQRNVGNYTSAWGKLGMRLKSVASAFGLIGGVMGAVSVIKSAFNVVVNFDTAIANLGAITNATDEDLNSLTENAKALGETTKFTATEVAGLSVELAKLGFTTDEILASTDSILALASATGTDLANASFIAGSTLRAFNLEANEMDRVASVLGVATTKSALNMEFLGTAMSKVAPVSSALGFSIEDTTALLGTLANAGFDASTSATATRNILLNLADTSGDLAKALGRPIKNIDDLAPALAELEAKGIDVATALELTDKRSVSAFKTFLNNTDTMIGLRDSITDVNKELAEMSEKQLDTISGQLALLNSKWQRTILGLSESSGAVEKLKNNIKFLTTNLETILRVIGSLIKALIVFKTTQIAINLVTKISTTLQRLYRFAVAKTTTAQKLATIQTKLFNTALKSNPLGLIISLLTTAIALLWDYSDATNEVTESVDRLSKAFENLKTEQNKYFKNQDFEQQKSLALIDLEIAQAKKRGASQKELSNLNLKRLKTEQQANSRKEFVAYDELLKMKTLRDEAQKSLDKDLRSLGTYKKLEDDQNIKFYTQRVASSQLTLDNANLELEAQQKLLKDLKNEGELLKINEKTTKVGFEISKKGNKTKTKTLKKFNELAKEYNKLIQDRIKIIAQIEQEQINQQIQNAERRAEKELELQLKLAEETGEADLTLYKSIIDEKFALEKRLIQDITYLNINKLQSDNQIFVDGLNNKLEQEKIYLAKAVKEGTISQTKADEIIKKRTNETNSIILQSEKKLDEEIELLRVKQNNSYEDLQKDKVDATEQAEQEILDTIQTNQDKISKEDKDILKKRLDAYKEFTNQIIQLIDKQTDKKIDAINKELSESEKREDELRQLAQKGTITANQSLASEQKRQAELERQKAELEKKKLRRQAILSGLDLLSSKLENDEPDAVTSTIRDITSLIGILSTLPAFAEGTDFVERGNSPKGKDKIIARIDEGERIMTKDQNKKIGGISNEQLTNIAQSYKSGSFNDVNYIQPKVKELNQPYQSNKMILDKFDSLQKTIEQKPMLTEVRWDSISKMIIEKVETKNRIDNNHKSSKGIF
tara:strand:- start:7886 stop:11629 length:3744 start_codon:yes stop_codon:yes gene_type:complete